MVGSSDLAKDRSAVLNPEWEVGFGFPPVSRHLAVLEMCARLKWHLISKESSSSPRLTPCIKILEGTWKSSWCWAWRWRQPQGNGLLLQVTCTFFIKHIRETVFRYWSAISYFGNASSFIYFPYFFFPNSVTTSAGRAAWDTLAWGQEVHGYSQQFMCFS